MIIGDLSIINISYGAPPCCHVAEVETLREQSNVGTRIFSSFLECPIFVDWTGGMGKMPGLAKSWRRIDDRTLELTLRDGV